MTTAQQIEIKQLIKEILGEAYTHLVVQQVQIEEDLTREQTTLTCRVTDETSGEEFAISGAGVGVVDAFFHAMKARFSAEYPSLKTIRFNSFTVQGQLDTRTKEAGSDSEGEVSLVIANSEGRLFSFSHSSRSVIGSSIITTLLGVEHFINAERAFVLTHQALLDARQRNRPDLVQQYTSTLSTLVQNTSYSEVIHRLKEQL